MWLSEEARADLERLSREDPERQIIFCTGCGHVHTGGKSGRRFGSGDFCDRTIQTGTPHECLAAFDRAAPSDRNPPGCTCPDGDSRSFWSPCPVHDEGGAGGQTLETAALERELDTLQAEYEKIEEEITILQRNHAAALAQVKHIKTLTKGRRNYFEVSINDAALIALGAISDR